MLIITSIIVFYEMVINISCDMEKLKKVLCAFYKCRCGREFYLIRNGEWANNKDYIRETESKI